MTPTPTPTPTVGDLAAEISAYQDVLSGSSTREDAVLVRDILAALVKDEQERVKGRPAHVRHLDAARVVLDRAGVHHELAASFILAGRYLGDAVEALTVEAGS